MLVLERQLDESILIGQDIEVIVIEVRGETVRLGIRAPRHVSIWRREIADAEGRVPVALSARDP